MRFVQGAQAHQPVGGPGGAAPRCHVDADRDRFGGGCQPALACVKHGHEEMYALRVEVDQLKGEIKRIALAQLVLVGDMSFQRKRAAAGCFDARRTQAERVPAAVKKASTISIGAASIRCQAGMNQNGANDAGCDKLSNPSPRTSVDAKE